ncbi:NlpC/P60 family protein [Micromonospora zhanjiangensis]
MTRNRSRRQGRLREIILPVLRPLLWSTVLGAAVAFAFANPVYADPALPGTVPDVGARPAPIGAVQLPGQVTPTGPNAGSLPVVPGLGTSPLAGQLAALETEVATLGDQLLTLRQDRDTADAAVLAARGEVDTATAKLAQASKAAEDAAGKALKEAAALPPGAFGSDLHGLGELSRIQRGQPNGTDLTAQNREVALAQTALQAANAKLADATGRQTTATADFTRAEQHYRQRESALLALRKQNQTELLRLEQARDAAEQKLGAGYLDGSSIAGMAADPRALAAVRYALAQLGDPYVWGAEGPNQFDCSGLMWAAYRTPAAGSYQLPRVAKDQYAATQSRRVDPSALLPGDLLFFGPSASGVHHVGMYIGGGRMVHAPTSGDVVKIAPVWWSHFFAATRIYGAIPAPKPPATPKPPTSPTPPASPKPTPTPTKPSPTPTKPSPTPTLPTRPTGPTTPPTTSSTQPTPTTGPSGGETTPSGQPSSLAPSGETSAKPVSTTPTAGS